MLSNIYENLSSIRRINQNLYSLDQSHFSCLWLQRWFVCVVRDLHMALLTITCVIVFCAKRIYERCVEVVNHVAPRLLRFSDEEHVYESGAPVNQLENEFNINQAICNAVKTLTDQREDQDMLDAIGRNYLGKAAKIDHQTMEMLIPINRHMNVPPMDDFGTYHRWSFLNNSLHWGVPSQVASLDSAIYLRLDDDEIDGFYPLSFDVMDLSAIEATRERIQGKLDDHYRSHRHQFFRYKLNKAILFDVTDILGNTIYTNQQGFSQDVFDTRYTEQKQRFENILDQVFDQFLRAYPRFSRRQIRKFIKLNVCCISKVSYREGGLRHCGVLILNLFEDRLDLLKLPEHRRTKTRTVNDRFFQFVSDTGLYTSPGEFRRKNASLFDIALQERPQLTEHVAGEALVEEGQYFYTYDDDGFSFTQTALFTRLREKMAFIQQGIERTMHQSDATDAEAQYFQRMRPFHVLCDSLLRMIDECFRGIAQEPGRWEELHDQLIARNILQMALFRLHQHLTSLEMWLGIIEPAGNSTVGNFSRFTDYIELSHAELRTILAIANPYPYEDDRVLFSDIYINLLKNHEVLPEPLHGNATAGLAKTGVNAYAAAMVAAMQTVTDDHFSAVYSQGFYFEQIPFIGNDREITQVFGRGLDRKIDVYACQIHPGVEIATEHYRYESHNVRRDIDRILRLNRTTNTKLTVIMDCTIDYVESEDIRQLLLAYQHQVLTGNLNFVFFRSGQKYDMYGLDNYYGAPFFIVNNQEGIWRRFNEIPICSAVKADELTHNYFSMSYLAAPVGADEYRRLVFDNARYLIDRTPPELIATPENIRQRIRISQAGDGMNLSYLDIKVYGFCHYLRSLVLMRYFYYLCSKEDVKAYTRASFGFQHTNFITINVNFVPDSTTIRLSPGICRDELDVVVRFLNDLRDYI